MSQMTDEIKDLKAQTRRKKITKKPSWKLQTNLAQCETLRTLWKVGFYLEKMH